MGRPGSVQIAPISTLPAAASTASTLSEGSLSMMTTAWRPSWEHANASTCRAPPCSSALPSSAPDAGISSVHSRAPSSAFHSLTVPSPPPVTSLGVPGPGTKEPHCTKLVWPKQYVWISWAPSMGFFGMRLTRIFESRSVVARSLPSSERRSEVRMLQ